jgi:hypothetical protein
MPRSSVTNISELLLMKLCAKPLSKPRETAGCSSTANTGEDALGDGQLLGATCVTSAEP